MVTVGKNLNKRNMHAYKKILLTHRQSRFLKIVEAAVIWQQFTLITRRPFWSPWGIKALSLHCLCPSSLTLNERFDGQNLLFGHRVIWANSTYHSQIRSNRGNCLYGERCAIFALTRFRGTRGRGDFPPHVQDCVTFTLFFWSNFSNWQDW